MAHNRLLAWVRTTLAGARNLIHPPLCSGCGCDLETPCDDSLCVACRTPYMNRSPVCSRCAAPIGAMSEQTEGCVYCSETTFHFQRITSLGAYDDAIERHILRLKHAGEEALAFSLGRLLAAKIRAAAWSPPPNLIAPIPMHWMRRLMRGVNSAETLAESLGDALSLPIARDLGRVIRRTPRQASLTPSRRRRNMKQAYAVNPAYDLKGAHLLVVDDVLTTGATANAFCFALKQAGAASISLAVAARGIGLE